LGNIYAFEASTGLPIWNATSPSGIPVVGPSGVVYVAGDRAKTPNGKISNLFAFNGANGKVLWTSASWDMYSFSPCVLDEAEKICVLGTTKNMYVYGISTEDGSTVWQADFGVPVYQGVQIAPVASYGLIRNNIVYLPITSFGVVALNAFTGEKVYNGSAPRFVFPDTCSNSSSAALSLWSNSDDKSESLLGGVTEYCSFPNQMFCSVPLKSLPNWNCADTSFAFAVSAQPVVTADGIALLADCSSPADWGGLTAFDLHDHNKILWTTNVTEMCAFGQPVVGPDGTIFIVDIFGRFFAFRVDTP